MRATCRAAPAGTATGKNELGQRRHGSQSRRSIRPSRRATWLSSIPPWSPARQCARQGRPAAPHGKQVALDDGQCLIDLRIGGGAPGRRPGKAFNSVDVPVKKASTSGSALLTRVFPKSEVSPVSPVRTLQSHERSKLYEMPPEATRHEEGPLPALAPRRKRGTPLTTAIPAQPPARRPCSHAAADVRARTTGVTRPGATPTISTTSLVSEIGAAARTQVDRVVCPKYAEWPGQVSVARRACRRRRRPTSRRPGIPLG